MGRCAARAAPDTDLHLGTIVPGVPSHPPPQEIGTIASLIKDVADQTEMLALNAAIRAAVVAEEVRRVLIVWPQGEAPRGALAVTAVRGLRTLQPAPDQGHDAPRTSPTRH